MARPLLKSLVFHGPAQVLEKAGALGLGFGLDFALGLLAAEKGKQRRNGDGNGHDPGHLGESLGNHIRGFPDHGGDGRPHQPKGNGNSIRQAETEVRPS